MGSAILVVIFLLVFLDQILIRNNLVNELTGLARVTAQRSAAALMFDDKRNATQNLKNLSVRSSLLAACIYKKYPLGPKLFAEHHLSENFTCAPNPQEMQLTNEHIQVVEKIAQNNTIIGSIHIISDKSPLKERAVTWVYLGAMIFAIAMSFAFFITRRMRSSIVNPLHALSLVMKNVVDSNDLGLRANAHGKDEVGALVQQFNTMLDIIENGQHNLESMYRELITNSTKAEKAAAELESKNQQMSEIISGAAHDLRQPLQAMSIFTESIQQRNHDEALTPTLSKLQRAINNFDDLFNEILNASRIEARNKEDQHKLISLNGLMAHLQVEFQALANKKNLKFRIHSKHYEIKTIPGILERIIRNIISNAINYTEAGGVLLSARMRKNEFLIEVWDTGRGIPAEKQQSIFEKFEQADKITDQAKGYGLGLALVRQFCDMLGYQISVRSEVNQGSRFTISIPTSCVHPVVPKQKSESAKPSVYDSTSDEIPENTNILLVDDDDLIRDSLLTLFSAWDIHCVDFSSLASLENYLKSGDYEEFDLLISDYQLSETTTGGDVVRLTREHLGYDIPAFIVTGNTEDHIHQEIHDQGLEFIQKPVQTRELRNTIARYLGD